MHYSFPCFPCVPWLKSLLNKSFLNKSFLNKSLSPPRTPLSNSLAGCIRR